MNFLNRGLWKTKEVFRIYSSDSGRQTILTNFSEIEFKSWQMCIQGGGYCFSPPPLTIENYGFQGGFQAPNGDKPPPP